MQGDIVRSILREKIIAIVREVDSRQIERVVESLLKGKIKCIELALSGGECYNEEDVLHSIQLIRKKYGNEVLVGAGTILTTGQVNRAYDMGAQYMISPNVNFDVIRQTKQKGCVSIPGAYTPTEIECANEYGADFIKLFPAGNAGVSYIRSLSVPLKKIPFIAVGGIDHENIADFLCAGAVAAGIGGKLVDPQLIEQGKYQELALNAEKYYRKVHCI